MFKSKLLSITILTLLFVTVIVGGNTYAQDTQTSLKNLNLRAGVSYFKINDKDFSDQNLDSGFGFYVGGNYKIQDAIGLIGQYERYSISESVTETDYYGNSYTYNTNLNLNAFVGLLSYDIMASNPTSISLLRVFHNSLINIYKQA